jgi:thymidylate kinase
MASVAIIGADGAGKSTICKLLIERSALPLKYVYMGVNLEASSVMLPTTRLLLSIKKLRGRRPDATFRPSAQERSGSPGLKAKIKSCLRLIFWVSEEWYRQLIAWLLQNRGYTAVFDRHFFADYFAYDVEPGSGEIPLTNRVHGYMLKKLYPRPSLFILLRAPPEVLYARKQESTIDFLSKRQEQYMKLRNHVDKFEIVDATRPQDDVVRSVDELIRQHLKIGDR